MLNLDLNRLEQQRQAGRGHNHVGGDLLGFEHPDFAGANLGGAQKQLGSLAALQRIEVHRIFEDPAQGVEVEGVELVGGKDPRPHRLPTGLTPDGFSDNLRLVALRAGLRP